MSSLKTGVSGNVADRLKAQIQELASEKRAKVLEVSNFYDKAIAGLQNTLKDMGVNGITFSSKPIAVSSDGKRRPGRPKGSKNKQQAHATATQTTVKRGPGRPKGSGTAAKPADARKRPHNERKLRDVVLEVVNESPESLYLLDITKKVVEKGYRSTAKNFASMVYQTLQEMVSQEKSVKSEKGDDGRKMKYGVVKKAA